jgi:hypothetical protein
MPVEYCQESDVATINYEGFAPSTITVQYTRLGYDRSTETYKGRPEVSFPNVASYAIDLPDRHNLIVVYLKTKNQRWVSGGDDAPPYCSSGDGYYCINLIKLSDASRGFKLNPVAKVRTKAPYLGYTEYGLVGLDGRTLFTTEGDGQTYTHQRLRATISDKATHDARSIPSGNLDNKAWFTSFTDCIDTWYAPSGSRNTEEGGIIFNGYSLRYSQIMYRFRAFDANGNVVGEILRTEIPLVTAANAAVVNRVLSASKARQNEVIEIEAVGRCQEVYNKNLITGDRRLVGSFCGLGGSPPAYTVSCGSEDCPPDTCKVDCHTHYCCYNSQGISVFNFLK